MRSSPSLDAVIATLIAISESPPSSKKLAVGEIDAASTELIEAVRLAMWAGATGIGLGARVTDISHAIQKSIRSHRRRFGIIREYTGHGIGSEMHMEPDVPNWYRPRPTARLEVGTALAIEPMLTRGTHHTLELDDEWTVVSRDGARGSHWENTVAITPRGIWVLTEPDGGESRLGDRFGPLAD